MIRADKKYNGVVVAGSSLGESMTGTPFFQVMLECEDGETYFQIWLTDKNREKAIKYFELLGADTSRLGDQRYLEYEIPNVITGKEVAFGTREEEYNGKTSTKVSYIGKRSDPNLAKTAAQLFGGKPTDAGIDDRDIPF